MQIDNNTLHHTVAVRYQHLRRMFLLGMGYIQKLILSHMKMNLHLFSKMLHLNRSQRDKEYLRFQFFLHSNTLLGMFHTLSPATGYKFVVEFHRMSGY